MQRSRGAHQTGKEVKIGETVCRQGVCVTSLFFYVGIDKLPDFDDVTTES